MNNLKLLTAREAAKVLRGSAQSLYDARYRQRLGLRAVRFGKKLLFYEADIKELLVRERLPGSER